jgi:hypothetical protein
MIISLADVVSAPVPFSLAFFRLIIGFQSRELIRHAASPESMTGYTSHSTMSVQFDIH